MKEIKAYLRPTVLDSVIRDLEAAGARDITVIRVDAIGANVDEDTAEHHFFQKYGDKYCAVAKLEIVCRDGEAGRFVDLIRQVAYTGATGDGRIFIAEIADAINVRTGARGEAAL